MNLTDKAKLDDPSEPLSIHTRERVTCISNAFIIFPNQRRCYTSQVCYMEKGILSKHLGPFRMNKVEKQTVKGQTLIKIRESTNIDLGGDRLLMRC